MPRIGSRRLAAETTPSNTQGAEDDRVTTEDHKAGGVIAHVYQSMIVQVLRRCYFFTHDHPKQDKVNRDSR
jgi:hypothetical protein